MSAATLSVWVAVAGAVLMGARRLVRALVDVITALEKVSELSATFGEWTKDMREWQGETENRIVRLEALQMAGDRS